MRHPDTGLAYLFWVLSFAGFAGLHRFYLGKPISGLFYLMTWGFFGIGTILDGLRMGELVRHAHLQRRIDQMLASDYESTAPEAARPVGPTGRGRSRRQSVEHMILGYAMESHGIVSPSRVALAAEIPPEKAREHLERLVVQGFANASVTRDSAMIYVFPEFLDDQGRRELVDLTGSE